MKSKWVILDRDGVINIDSENYIKSAAEWQPIPGSIQAIASLKRAGYHVAVLTNQSGLARGLFLLEDLEAMHNKLQTLLDYENAHVDAIFYCPHLPEDNCICRKPAGGLLDALERECNMSCTDHYFVGDSLKDIQLAKNRNCLPVLVRTGKGMQTESRLLDDPRLYDTPVYDDLASFVSNLLKRNKT